MPRIRAIKPEFFTHERLAELPALDRLFFIGLWTVADKAGRIENRPKRLKVQIMPYDDYDVVTGIERLRHGEHIVCYRDTAGRELIAIPSWPKHQRPHHTEKDSELPSPEGLTESPLDNRYETENLRPLTLGVGVGVGVQGRGRKSAAAKNAHADSASFDAFWQAYPKKKAKDAARKAWGRRKPDAALQARILSAIAAQSRSEDWTKDGGKFIPFPATWLNQGRWQDETDGPVLVASGGHPKHCTHEPPCPSDVAHSRRRREEQEAAWKVS